MPNKCSRCQKDLCKELGLDPFHDWLMVMHYLEIELTQGEITNATYETLTNAMMTIRPDEEEAQGD